MKSFFKMLMVMVFCLSLLGLLSSGSYAKDTVTLRYANLFPPVHKISLLIDEYTKEVERRTDGRVKIEHFPGSTLARPTGTYDAILKGIADIGVSFVPIPGDGSPCQRSLTSPWATRVLSWAQNSIRPTIKNSTQGTR